MTKRRPTGPRLDRRTTLKGLGAAALTPLVPGCVTTEDEVPFELLESIRENVDVVVLLMMENRSFDHYFGAMKLVEGREEVDGLDDGMSNPHPDGGDVLQHPADANCVADPPHGWNASHTQWGEGECDGFVAAHAARHGADEAHRVMGWFDRDMLSASYTLADHYAVCQRWFCSLMTSTWPNRFYSLAAQSGGNKSNTLPEDDFPSIFDRLDDVGRLWRTYFSNAPFSVLLPQTLFDESQFRPIDDFYDHAESGVLPDFTLLEPIYGRNDDHPPAHPLAGQILIASVYDALSRSPQWERSLLIVTYDEHGGWFDHVSPPTAPDERAEDGFDQLGFRVPSLVIGPWVKQGHVSDTVYDHTSVLAFLHTLYGTEPLTLRDAAANDLTDLFDAERLAAGQPAAPVTLPVIEADEDEIYALECAGPLFRGEGEPVPIGNQPELDALLDAEYRGTPVDRRHLTMETFRALLDRAQERGLLTLK